MPVPSPVTRELDEREHEARSVDALLAAHQPLIERIKLSFGIDRAAFCRDVLPLIRAYAQYVSWLPATPTAEFAVPGGLFQLGLETAFVALQGTDGHIFSGKLTISARSQLEPRWRRATFLAGLCAELHRAVGPIVVRDDAGQTWPSLLCPLASWLEQRPAQRYALDWRATASDTRNLGLLAVRQVIPDQTLQFLANGNDVILAHLLASIGGLPLHRGRNALDDLARRALALVIERDLAAHDGAGSWQREGHHQLRYLVEGLQWLTSNESAWRPNQEKSRVWFATDGLYLVWPGALQDLARLLERQQLAGMPADPGDLTERLGEVLERTADGSLLWTIHTPEAATPLQAIKLASPLLLLGALDTVPVALTGPLARDRRAAAPDPPDPPVPPDPPQTALFEPAAPPASPDAIPSPVPDDARAPQWRLRAPLRLNVGVAHALATILDRQSDQVVLDPDTQTLFVPLHLFEGQHLAPALVLRALAEVGMLATDAAATTAVDHQRSSDGSTIAGARLRGRFVETVAGA